MNGTVGHATSTTFMIDMRRTGGAWREQVWDRIGHLRADLVALNGAEPNPAREQAAAHLARAEEIANDSAWTWMGRRGSRIEATWRELRLAEEALIHAAPDSEVPDIADRALLHGRATLDPMDPPLTKLQECTKAAQPRDTERLRALSADVTRRSHEVSDAQHRALRGVGEQIAAAAAGLAALAIVLVALIAQLELELLPPVSTGDRVIAGWAAVLLAMASGLVGAMFSAIPSVSLIPEKRQPFNPVWRQAALKMVIGAWSGFIGLIAVTAGLVEPLASPAADAPGGTLAGFVMTAALFGAGQEAVTRFADRKATVLRDAATR